ncbi:hypothetical protein [Saccharopolyspora mangrovi]|uniref:Nitrate reductase n=1 Tax=Saccharopolyspora mangrovi TaxID=3082379 RepID=A0ABU6AHF7_9PSEU|nr:hypothetical protein [Saccharopolyspora sp. S2-29]MEB3370941.1 hypothetical protein [Saccharopolyspora sp. S2-29]
MNDALNQLLGRSSRPEPDRAARSEEIADLVRTTLNLGRQVSITVQQLACAEPGCPPIETKIVVLGLESKRWTIHAPVSEVDDDTVRNTLTTRPEGDSA